MDKVTIAYFAGFFDGEGTVDIRYRLTNRGKYERFELRVAIVQMDVAPLLELKELFGGSICLPAGSKVSRWLVCGQDAIKFLMSVQPYLRVKSDEVLIALAYANLINSFQYGFAKTGGFAKEPEHIRNMKIIYMHEIRAVRDSKGISGRNRNTIRAA